VDRSVDLLADATYATGRALRVLQTGRIREYVTFIAAGVLCLFILLFTILQMVTAG
jgi:hypothetical protein